MFDLSTIKAMNREAGKLARDSGKEPFLLRSETDRALLRQIPNFGSYRPKGWRLVKTYFVDSSGFGGEDEPALTYNQFIRQTKVGRAYAIVEEGQFQVNIGEFVKK